ncbi:nuclear receptor ROR-alpha [Platysternon megacephalum]|uniref:Nuclear receptor ROR-alpha n=1 Tax=Platysternon megacephalum TaxID=55544 RepID=A0A4D9ELB8_9SAUR|nr:nuclear receptor ROR-alpha [Platysternon megacephalum]
MSRGSGQLCEMLVFTLHLFNISETCLCWCCSCFPILLHAVGGEGSMESQPITLLKGKKHIGYKTKKEKIVHSSILWSLYNVMLCHSVVSSGFKAEIFALGTKTICFSHGQIIRVIQRK